jgi:hypothetical protein
MPYFVVVKNSRKSFVFPESPRGATVTSQVGYVHCARGLTTERGNAGFEGSAVKNGLGLKKIDYDGGKERFIGIARNACDTVKPKHAFSLAEDRAEGIFLSVDFEVDRKHCTLVLVQTLCFFSRNTPELNLATGGACDE